MENVNIWMKCRIKIKEKLLDVGRDYLKKCRQRLINCKRQFGGEKSDCGYDVGTILLQMFIFIGWTHTDHSNWMMLVINDLITIGWSPSFRTCSE